MLLCIYRIIFYQGIKMRGKDYLGEEHELFRGQTVRWVDRSRKALGTLTGIICRIDDTTVSVQDVDGGYHNINPVYLTLSSDDRNLELRSEDPELAREKANEYADVWENRYVLENGGEEKITVSRKARSAASAYDNQFVKLLEQSEYRLTKSDFMENIEGLSLSSYTATVRSLISAKRIVQSGTRKGASYGLPGRTYEEAPKKERESGLKKEREIADITHIIEYLKEAQNPMSRAELREVFGFSDKEWSDIAYALKNSMEVTIMGKKKGTKYVAY